MLNTVHFDPWQRSLFVPSVSSANTKEKGPLLAGKVSESESYVYFDIRSMNLIDVEASFRMSVRHDKNLLRSISFSESSLFSFSRIGCESGAKIYILGFALRYRRADKTGRLSLQTGLNVNTEEQLSASYLKINWV